MCNTLCSSNSNNNQVHILLTFKRVFEIFDCFYEQRSVLLSGRINFAFQEYETSDTSKFEN